SPDHAAVGHAAVSDRAGPRGRDQWTARGPDPATLLPHLRVLGARPAGHFDSVWFQSQGLPVGLQIVGRRRGEAAVLRAAAAFEAAQPWAAHVPPIVRRAR